MKWIKYITIHHRINIRLQYIRNTSEYILKLRLHQHSLLTRKVFSQHNLIAQVFFSVSYGSSSSLRHLHLQFISIFKSSLSSSHLHLQVIFTWIWIIVTGSGSSLDLDHLWSVISGSRSSLDLDHQHWIFMGDISWFFSSQEVIQIQPFFMLVVGLPSVQVFSRTYIWP